MASVLEICNQALSVVGTRSSISSLSEDSVEAAQCALHYPGSLAGALRVHLWNFARRQAPAALLMAAAGTIENPTGVGPFPPDPWLYAYAWPAKCVRMRRIYLPFVSVTIPFAIGVDLDPGGNAFRMVMTDASQASFIYTMLIEDPNLWSDGFDDVVVYALAARLSGPLAGSKTTTQLIARGARDALLQAQVVDSGEVPNSPEHIPDWIAARNDTEESNARVIT